jgi:protein SCO1/2
MTIPENEQVVPRSRWLPVLWALISLGLLAGIGLLTWSLLHPYSFHGVVLQSPSRARNFTLTGQNGQPVSLTDFSGKVVLLYFGYTTCPDVCPTTLADLRTARESLGALGEQVQVLMITVDPQRDTQAVLADYMSHFDSSFLGLTGTPEQIAEVATYYGIYYEKAEGNPTLGYLMNHTATVMAVDKDGFLRVVFPFGTPAQDIADDLNYLLKR